MSMEKKESPTIYPHNREQVVKELGKNSLLEMLRQMLTIRHFEMRAESSYQQGKIGGFLHLYIGEEAIQTAALKVLGPKHWYIASYRCHALALLLAGKIDPHLEQWQKDLVP